MKYLDRHPDVLLWASEEIVIPYISPLDKRMHRYYPDFYVEMINTKGNVDKLLIEVKPSGQTTPPNMDKRSRTKTGKPTKRFIHEAKTYAVNEAKWKAAQRVCEEKGWTFKIMTEKDLL